MRNPKKVKIIIFGLKEFDEQKYFRDNEAYIEEEKLKDFPLNQIGQNQGIRVQRLKNYIQIKYPLKVIKGKLIFFFYNHYTKKFENMQKLLKDDFIFLNLEFCDAQKPLLIRLSFILDKYQIRNYLKEYEDNISSLKKKLDKLQKQLKNQFYQIKKINEEKNKDISQRKKYDIAILYSHPLYMDGKKPVQFNKEIQNFKKRMQDLNKNFSYYITQATKHNLEKVLRQNPKIIHIISHGGIDKDLVETYLEFEKELKDETDFGVDKVNESNIIEILDQPCNRALIFFGCCHAGKMAKIFNQNCYPSVAIDQLLKLTDKAAISYFQCFYEQLLQKQTFLKCHEEAKKNVEKELGNSDFQDCLSHKHTKNCKKLFKEQIISDIQTYQLTSVLYSCCEPKQDILQHKWNDECNVKQNFKTFLVEENEDKIKEHLKRLDKVAQKNNGLLKICCCELAEIIQFNSDDFENHLKKAKFQIEHRSSKTFQFFGDEQCRLFNFIEVGDQIQKNKIEWQEEHMVYIQEAQDILQNLYKIFKQKNITKIIIFEIDKIFQSEVILQFVQQVTNYFKQRYIDQSKLKDIKIQVLENINQIYNYQEQESIKYIFINKINQEEWNKNKKYLLNQKVAIILITYDDINDDDHELNKVQLLDFEDEDTEETNKQLKDFYDMMKLKNSEATVNQQQFN